MKSRWEGILASIFLGFWWILEAKLGWKTEPRGSQRQGREGKGRAGEAREGKGKEGQESEGKGSGGAILDHVLEGEGFTSP